MHQGENYGSAVALSREALRTASVIRERLSPDAWRLVVALEARLDIADAAPPSEVEAFDRADQALRALAALSGLMHENINRVAGWRFLDMGRRIERGIATCRFARIFATPDATADDLDVVLDLIDSQITYRSRYRAGVALAPARDMVVLDPYNPRSVAFQVAQIDAHLADLPVLRNDGILETPRRMSTSLNSELAVIEAEELDGARVLGHRAAHHEARRRGGFALFPARTERHPRRQTARSCVIYDVRHVTTYSYDAPVAFARCALRLLPRDETHQRVLSSSPRHQSAHRFFASSVRTSSATAWSMSARDGASAIARRGALACRGPARRAFLVAHEPGMGGGQPAAPSPRTRSRLPRLRISSIRAGSSPCSSRSPFMQGELSGEGAAIIDGAADLMHRIRADFRYDPKATAISTPLLEAFERRVGVCQDFAHVMIAGLRGLGLPAAYVSGYIRSVPAPGKERLEGADASHAWVSLWCGPEEGWIGFDPTNDREVANEHVVLAIGRDYDDISPIHGILLGPGEQEIDVGVDVVPWTGAAA